MRYCLQFIFLGFFPSISFLRGLFPTLPKQTVRQSLASLSTNPFLDAGVTPLVCWLWEAAGKRAGQAEESQTGSGPSGGEMPHHGTTHPRLCTAPGKVLLNDPVVPLSGQLRLAASPSFFHCLLLPTLPLNTLLTLPSFNVQSGHEEKKRKT